jgi:hypothetical protein
MSKITVIDKYMARLLMVCMVLPGKVQGAVPILVSVYFVVRTFMVKESLLSKNYKAALLISTAFLMYLLSFPFMPHEYLRSFQRVCEGRASMLLLPLVFAGITPTFTALIWKERYYLVYACIASCVIGNAAFAYHYLLAHDGTALSHVAYRTIFDLSTSVHPTYMCMFLAFSICIALLSGDGEYVPRKWIRYILMYLMLVLLLCLLAKTPIIALLAVFVHYGWVNKRQLYRYKGMMAGVVVAVMAVYLFVPFFRQRVGELSGFFGKSKTENVIDNSVAMRKLIWHTDVDMLHHYWLTGTGPGRLFPLLKQRYFFYSLYSQEVIGPYDPHNEYMYDWLSLGMLGIVSLLFVLGVHFAKAIRRGHTIYLYLLVILSISFFTESVLSLQQGVLFYSIFTSLLFFLPREEKVAEPGQL